MKLKLLIASLIFTMAGRAQENKPNPGTESLYRSEKEFSAYCVKHGIKESFTKYFDDKAITFSPHAVNAKGFYQLEPADSGYLSWEPKIVEISHDGTLGFTIGPAGYRKSYHPDDTVYHSHYFSVWQKADGIWKVVLDKGIRYKDKFPESEVKYFTHSDSKNSKNSFKDVVTSDNESTKQSYEEYTDHQTIFGRKGSFPFTAKDTIPKDLQQIKTWKVLDGQIARSGDFVYMYGYYELNNSSNEKGYFVRVWTFKSGKWILRIDIRSPYQK